MTTTITKRRVTHQVEACDCGGEYPCSHGAFLYAVYLDEPKPEWVKWFADKGEPVPEWANSYSEVCEFPAWLGTLLLLGPELAESLQRCVGALDAVMRCSGDAAVEAEAITALMNAQGVLGQLDKDPVDLAWEAADGETQDR